MSKIEYRLERFGTLVVLHVLKRPCDFKFKAKNWLVLNFNSDRTSYLSREEIAIGKDVDNPAMKTFRTPEFSVQIVTEIKEALEEYNEQEDKKKDLPRWKIGDCVVLQENTYLKIVWIRKHEWEWIYDWSKEKDLRDPTPEELSLYFR